MVHRKVLAPTPRAVRPEVGEVGAVIVPAPEINVHKPVPTAGAFPARVAVVAQIAWSMPAVATVGTSLLVIITSSVEAVQGALEMVHLNVFAPTPSAVSPEVGEDGVVMVPTPEISVHNPVPTPGAFPARVAVVAQMAWSVLAADTVGTALLVMITSSIEAVQGALEIVHLNVLAPTPRAVSPEVGEEGVVIVPAPEINVHKPVPTVGVFPARVAEVAQIV